MIFNEVDAHVSLTIWCELKKKTSIHLDSPWLSLFKYGVSVIF